ncbi:MAG: DJ-1/PfpI family protein [Cyanobacteria bacterium P01_E01_bin.6]
MTENVAYSPESSSATQVVSMASGIPAYAPRFNRARPVIAVVAENSFTELTDYVIPYGVLSESGVAQVFALATKEEPIRMLPALRIEPQATVAEFDSRFPEGADYVVVPAVVRQKDPILLGWIGEQAKKGATIIGICDGVWVLANAGLLNGRKSVGHWYSFNSLENKFPKTEWLRNTRYVADGNIITTTGVTASIPVSVALVEAIAGWERAASLARSMGIQSWGSEHQSEQFKLTAKHIFTAAANWLSFWLHEDIGIPINNGVDEVALSLVADTYSRTYRSKAFSLSSFDDSVTSKRGLVILPDRVKGVGKTVDRTIEMPSDLPSISSLDATLQEIEQLYGSGAAAIIALQLEYPNQSQK